jgi:endonuclease/exonuclease/phosphatase family metal-dependent hydrolase
MKSQSQRSPERQRPFVLLATLLSLSFGAAARLEASSPCMPLPVVEHPVTAAAQRPPGGTLTIASLNIAGESRIADALAAWVQQRAIDVLLLQEVGPTVRDGEAFTKTMSARLGFHAVYAPAYSSETYMQGLAIMSRYPLREVRADLLNYNRLRFRSRCRNALTATVVTTSGPMRVANVHLDTRINSKGRVAQLTPVVDAMNGVSGPQVVGGDFNSADIGWLNSMWPFPYAQRQPSAIRSMLTALGFETPFGKTRPTFKLLGLPLKLDWLYMKHLKPMEWNVDDVEYSDHRGIWVNVTSLVETR